MKPKPFRLRLPFIPASKKNRPEIRKSKRSQKRWVSPSRKAQRDEKAIHILAILEAQKHKLTGSGEAWEGTVFGDHDVHVEVTWMVPSDEVEVLVVDLGPKPKRGRSGRSRDAVNIPAVILDALPGVIFDDDKQVAELVVRRVL